MAPTNFSSPMIGQNKVTSNKPITDKGDKTTLSLITFIPEAEEMSLNHMGYIKMGRLTQTEVLLENR